MFQEAHLTYEPIFDIQIGVIMRRQEFADFGETQLFKRLFVLKGFSEDYTHYLPKKLETRVPG